MLGSPVLSLSLPKLLALLALAVVTIALASCSAAQGGTAMAARPQTQVEVPPLDQAAPTQFRTATFAMG